MTKRFTYVKNNSITQYQALPIQEIGKGKAFHCQGIVDKLNKLSDENEQLKSENQSWLKTASRMDTIHHEDREYCERIHRENEKLKSKLEESKKAHSNCDKLWWELHDEKEQLEKENQHLKSKINMLKVTIGRNEAHIKRLTEKSNWRTSAYD